ncbi:OLC1v1003420C1 [Oldenlandia corymbosa var. corymbosa]|uniref:OLC1v1003420C1 n=1 Tax=Oldenlandia corymbosa var. corymbosa TaxID=529605 RepID=A0AAV1DA03_OLDCO|nr:OLC1v1003420C1 [Oldenlandia corymbosa var. corymbosa]
MAFTRWMVVWLLFSLMLLQNHGYGQAPASETDQMEVAGGAIVERLVQGDANYHHDQGCAKGHAELVVQGVTAFLLVLPATTMFVPVTQGSPLMATAANALE